ncbi:hypothetical protein [Cohnella sp. AR92]|uniref:hypothetical protein n=1 Tax=Cohnella sp. AR92 TaxID=648716 RepID=UPI000F8D0890|nr:hypothetical protein [Cohnella sp. AR92]RUS47675.1 hypothetical protein ELR57_07780 [Cohnella sp. AR92]
MQVVTLNHLYPTRHSKPMKALLLEEDLVITSDGFLTSLVRVNPTEQEGVYVQAEAGNFIIVAKGGRTLASLEKIVRQLKTMDAYTLLYKHYDIQDNVFFINYPSKPIY